MAMASNSIIILSLLPFLLIFTCSKAELGHPKETNLTLYFQDFSGGGPNATVIEITSQPNKPLNFTKFGAVFCTDDPITKESKESSAQVARGQGVYITSSLDGSRTLVLISIVFTNGKYKGSTIEVQGGTPQFEVSEVAVVGGTGKFRYARGYATFETIHYDDAIHYAVIRCNVTVLHY